MSPAKTFQSLSPAWQALMTLAGAVSFGFMVALALSGWVAVPATVEAHGEAITANTRDIADLRRAQQSDSLRLVKIECYVVAIANHETPRCGL